MNRGVNSDARALINANYDWIGRVSAWRYKDLSGPQREAATDAGVPPGKWDSFCLMLVYMASEHGKHGQGMDPTQREIAAARGIRKEAVARWLALAVSLGALRQVSPAEPPYVSAVYDPLRFWQTPTQAPWQTYPHGSQAGPPPW